MNHLATISRVGPGDRTRVFAGDGDYCIQCGQSLATRADTDTTRSDNCGNPPMAGLSAASCHDASSVAFTGARDSAMSGLKYCRDRSGVGDHAVRDDQIPLLVVFDHACANGESVHEPVSTAVACDPACDGGRGV